MMVNNEIGTIQPISEIAKIIRKYRKTSKKFTIPKFRISNISYRCESITLVFGLECKKLGVDMLTIDGQKYT